MTQSLLESSIPHEYYLGDLPGNIQYNKSKSEIIATHDISDDDTRGYELAEHSIENKLRTLTHTKNPDDYKVLLVMKRVDGEAIWLKVAFEHKQTGDIALLTCSNGLQNFVQGRPMKSHCDGWYVGRYRMCAPMCFWRELKNRLTV